MTRALRRLAFLITGWLTISQFASGQEVAERDKLYTKPDPASTGGILGHITNPVGAIEQVLAIPFDTPEKVYAAAIEGDDKRSFRFTGLPMRKYDLIVIYQNSFFEGLELVRGVDTLNADDHKKIQDIVQKSEPYFTDKFIHRMEGTTGLGNEARGISTFLRARGSELLFTTHDGKSNRADFRRTIKLVILKSVGPGWQVVRTRDLYPVWVNPNNPKLDHKFTSALSHVRVADAIKDLGDLDLTK